MYDILLIIASFLIVMWFFPEKFGRKVLVLRAELAMYIVEHSPWSRAKTVTVLNRYAASDQFKLLQGSVGEEKAWDRFWDEGMFNEVAGTLTPDMWLKIIFTPYTLIDEFEPYYIRLGFLLKR